MVSSRVKRYMYAALVNENLLIGSQTDKKTSFIGSQKEEKASTPGIAGGSLSIADHS